MYMIDVFDITILYGMAAILGHIYPIFLGFKGGKAVATGVGAVIALVPYVGLAGILIFFIVALFYSLCIRRFSSCNLPSWGWYVP